MSNDAKNNSTAAPSTASSNGCPVNHSSSSSAAAPLPSFSLFSWPWAAASDITSRSLSSETTQQQQPAALSYQPASIEEAAQHAQTPQADQRIPLGTARQVSSIPRGGESLTGASTTTTTTTSTCPVNPASQPHHQHDATAQHWVYPSEQQLYNAMRRKGWTNVPEDSISTVLNIHNTINERTWRQIQDWEDSNNLTLVRFQGRPTEPSPKAWLLCNLLRLYDAPFDRHDWYVESTDDDHKIQQRYVIDYYYTLDQQTQLPRPCIDARPALDHPRAVLLHGKQFFKNAFPAISKRLFAEESTANSTRHTSAASQRQES